MRSVRSGRRNRFIGLLAAAAAVAIPLPAAYAGNAASAGSSLNIEAAFDQTFGTELRLPGTRSRSPDSFAPGFVSRVATVASPQQGRIGVAAVDLTTGRTLDVLGDQPFPMASTSKIAIAATYLDMVDRGKLKLDTQYPLLVPVPSKRFDGPVAPVRPGMKLSALSLIELAITRSDNPATDALLAAIGGPRAVNAWVRRTGIKGFQLDRDIATLVRDDGAVNPAVTIDKRDSATPLAMVQLLAGLHRGEWLSPASQRVLLGAMSRCVTGKSRIPGNLPPDIRVAHKTGTLYNTASDVGIITMPDGRSVAVAIYVTGQGGRPARNARIATISRAIYDGYLSEPAPVTRTAAR